MSAEIKHVIYSAAELTLAGTTVTAYELASTTGLAIVNGQTLSFRGPGLTVASDQVVSLGYDGLVDSTTSAAYAALATPTTLATLSKPTLPGLLSSLTSLTHTHLTLPGPYRTTTTTGTDESTHMDSSTFTTSTSTPASGSTVTTTTSTPSATGAGSSTSSAAQSSATSASGSNGASGVRRNAGLMVVMLGLLTGVMAYAC